MTQITIPQTTISGYQGSSLTATLKILADQDFRTSDAVNIPRNYIRDGVFYATVSCTIAGGVITIPSHTLDSTTDSSVPNGTYTAILYDSSNKRIQAFYSGWRIPTVFGTTPTWEQLSTYNGITPTPFQFGYPNTDQVQQLIDAAVDPLSGSIVETAIPNTASLNSFITTATASPSTKYSGKAGTNDLTISTATTQPANAFIEFKNGKKLVKSGTGTFTCAGPAIEGDPRYQIISGFAAEEFQWTGQYPDFLRPEWFGIVEGDSSGATQTANSAAWAVLMAALRSGDTDGLGGNFDPYLSGTEIRFGKGNYYFASSPQVNTQCRIYIPPGCQIVLPANTTGFRTNGQLTRDEGALDAADRAGAEGTLIYGGGKIFGTAGAATHNITLNGLTVTKLTGTNFSYQEGYLDGYTFTDMRNSISYIISGNPSGDPLNSTGLTIRPYKLYLTRTAPNTYTYYGIAAAPTAWIGATIVINGTSTTITGVQPAGSTSITTADDVALSSPATCSITSFPVANFTAFNARFNRFSGIDCRVRTIIDNVTVYGFPGHGVAFDSVRNPSTAHGTQPNPNMSRVDGVRAVGNHGAGFYSKAVNANNITFINIDTQGNRIGIFDAPQHANVYIAPHSALDIECVIQKDSVQGSHFVKPYIEEGTPNWDCDNAVIGPGTYDQGRGGGLQQYALGDFLTGAKLDSRMTTSALGTVAALVKLVVRMGTIFNGFFQFGQVNSSAVVVKSYHLLHYLAGKYGLAYYDNDNSSNPITATYDPVLELTTSDHTLGGGYLSFPKGIIIREPATARPAAAEARRGYIWNEEGGAGVADVLSFLRKNAADAYEWANFLLSSDLGANVAAFLATPSSANLASAITDETGTGALVFANTPTLVTPNIGAATGTSLALGGGTAMTKIVKGTITINPASINADTISTQTFTLTGAAVGDSLILNPPAAGIDGAILVSQPFVSATNTISITFYNTGGSPVDMGSADWTYTLIRS